MSKNERFLETSKYQYFEECVYARRERNPCKQGQSRFRQIIICKPTHYIRCVVYSCFPLPRRRVCIVSREKPRRRRSVFSQANKQFLLRLSTVVFLPGQFITLLCPLDLTGCWHRWLLVTRVAQSLATILGPRPVRWMCLAFTKGRRRPDSWIWHVKSHAFKAIYPTTTVAPVSAGWHSVKGKVGGVTKVVDRT